MSSKRVGAPAVIIRRSYSGWLFLNGGWIADGAVSFYASEQATTGKVVDGRRQSGNGEGAQGQESRAIDCDGWAESENNESPIGDHRSRMVNARLTRPEVFAAMGRSLAGCRCRRFLRGCLGGAVGERCSGTSWSLRIASATHPATATALSASARSGQSDTWHYCAFIIGRAKREECVRRLAKTGAKATELSGRTHTRA